MQKKQLNQNSQQIWYRSDNKFQLCTEFRFLQSMHLAWTVWYTLNFHDMHAYLPKLDNHSKTCFKIYNPHLPPLPSLVEFASSAQNRILFTIVLLWYYAKFYFELENFFKTWVQCVKQSTFIYGNVTFLGYTMSCPLFFLFIEGVVILYFLLCISVFQLAYFSAKYFI